MATKLSDIAPQIQAAAIISATQIALVAPTDVGDFKHIPSAKDVVKRAIEILTEYSKHDEIGTDA